MLTRRTLVALALVAAGTSGCQTPAASGIAQQVASNQPASDAILSPTPFTAQDFSARLQALASDEFGGRAPGSTGETLTLDYLIAQAKELGLQPGNGDSYTQTVPMVTSLTSPDTTLQLKTPKGSTTLKFPQDMVLGTTTGNPLVQLRNSEMVFVGYGVNAPELGWNDYEGLDVRGKTVVMLVNDPGFQTGDTSLFEGRRMTYYGRWTYKFEEAARQGAAAALIVHDNEGAAYGWEVVRNGWTGKQFDLPAADDPAPRLPVRGWLTQESARALFAAAGLDLAAQYKAASTKGFKPIPLKATATTTLKTTVSQSSSKNFVAKIVGTERPDEAVIYQAHWDHLGTHQGDDAHDHNTAAPKEDHVWNGAVDNATGVAGIMTIAQGFARAGTAPKRSVYFFAPTLEESGLLGSAYFVAHPSVALNKIAAVINIDALIPTGKARNLVLIGNGASELEDILKPYAAAQGRELAPENTPQDGFYFRSDHFNFAKAGVPALYIKGGDDLIEGGLERGRAIQEDYRRNRYHKPTDAFDPSWNLEGVQQDLQALYAVGREVANSTTWPRWYPGNAFRKQQEALRATP